MIKDYVRAANYLSAIQIYLWDNFLLEKPLSSDDIKSRLLGHWGTCPGINFVYAHLNDLIIRHKLDMMFILGPGHGFPALQANLFLERTLGQFYPEATQDESGIKYLAKNFSWPYGFPSHSNPGAPGVILEGGELGYSLSTAWGTVLDNPGLITACLVGDGEAETGALATSWHLSKFVDPKTNGAVLPILHLNGYKISGPTVFGRMNNDELKELFYGYGYEPIVVDGEDDELYAQMPVALETCLEKIKKLQSEGKAEKDSYPRFPMIILRTKKGWTGVKESRGRKIEDNALAHQVVCSHVKTDPEELGSVESWLRSYNFNELFDKEKGFVKSVTNLIPPPELAMGNNKHTFGLKYTGKPLELPRAESLMEDANVPGTVGSSSMIRMSMYLKEVFKLNKENKNFRLMSPDETYSNKLQAIFPETSRAFAGPIMPWDIDLSLDGRVMEMLSEHSLQGLAQGYILTGRHAVFASYEAFVQVVSSMADQYAKFLHVAREIPWRGDIPSLNYILTSSGWRQEHNGFSHQNPGFIDAMLQKQGCFVKVFFPPDGNTALAVLEQCLKSKNEINLIVAGKTVEPRWLNEELVKQELQSGLMTWDFASDPNPDLIFSAAGEYLTKEALAAMMIIREKLPEIKLRYVNILEISAIGIGNSMCKVPLHSFNDYYMEDKPVIFNFHGYPETLKQVLFDHQDGKNRFYVHGYTENGSTTTPFDLHLRNKTSRYDLAMEAFKILAERNLISTSQAEQLVEEFTRKIAEHHEYIVKNGVDPEEINNWTWKR
ncbi:MAG: phosphoketolase family protein [Minisyncoccota bacterium]